MITLFPSHIQNKTRDSKYIFHKRFHCQYFSDWKTVAASDFPLLCGNVLPINMEFMRKSSNDTEFCQLKRLQNLGCGSVISLERICFYHHTNCIMHAFFWPPQKATCSTILYFPFFMAVVLSCPLFEKDIVCRQSPELVLCNNPREHTHQ